MNRLGQGMRHWFLLPGWFFLISCTPSGHTPLVWSDEFDYTGQPDTTQWNYETGDGCPENCGWGNNEVEVYTKDPANVRVENGALVIEAVKTAGQWTSARITTQSKMSFTYGRIEFRAKLPAGTGTWPALWMLGENITTKGWPACGEVDVMEHVGRNPGVVQSALHTGGSHGDTVNKGSIKVNAFDSDFHLYEAVWTADRIQFFADGTHYYTYQPESKNEGNWPFNGPFFVIINLAMGGNFGGPEIDPVLSKVRMEVDYVRVYE